MSKKKTGRMSTEAFEEPMVLERAREFGGCRLSWKRMLARWRLYLSTSE